MKMPVMPKRESSKVVVHKNIIPLLQGKLEDAILILQSFEGQGLYLEMTQELLEDDHLDVVRIDSETDYDLIKRLQVHQQDLKRYRDSCYEEEIADYAHELSETGIEASTQRTLVTELRKLLTR